MPTQEEIDDPFHARLAIEQIDRDIFRGHCHAGISSWYQRKAPLRAFGGQIAAQSLMAAGGTVDAPDRVVHSLHTYFLHAAKIDDPITYLVDRTRETGSYSTRIVRAVQEGEVILMLTASFTDRQPGPEHAFMPPPTPHPDELPDADIPPADFSGVLRVHLNDMDGPLEMVDGRYERAAWIKFDHDLPDTPLVQASALTYLSDMTLLGTSVAPHGLMSERTDLMLASIDHAMWFSEVPKVDDWLLFAMDTPVARYGQGLARGIFFDSEGRQIATVAQETLMRERRK